MSDVRPRSYTGSDVTVTFDGTRCLHFAECLRGLPAVFDVRARPWISPDNADAAAVAEVVERCPSGALRHTRRDGVEETPPDPTVVTATEHGPILLHGDLTLTGIGQASRRETRMALCACGRSARRPFCDNVCRD
ncbi:(4Fe-4S)-binding protein [Streptosporangium sp. NPDC048865]|uniref:(4Fe-4S)-binding protein n=1 Tax=Streptosporangium sp. NPDC048865 TaxID=3155766 RepID=UPI003449A10D